MNRTASTRMLFILASKHITVILDYGTDKRSLNRPSSSSLNMVVTRYALKFNNKVLPPDWRKIEVTKKVIMAIQLNHSVFVQEIEHDVRLYLSPEGERFKTLINVKKNLMALVHDGWRQSCDKTVSRKFILQEKERERRQARNSASYRARDYIRKKCAEIRRPITLLRRVLIGNEKKSREEDLKNGIEVPEDVQRAYNYKLIESVDNLREVLFEDQRPLGI